MVTERPESGIPDMYTGRDFAAGPATYTSPDFFRKIHQATGLDKLNHPARVLDAMSGPGLVGSSLQALSPAHRYYYLDLTLSQLAKIPESNGRVLADVRKMPFGTNTFDVVVIRYGAKDIREEEQVGLFKEVHRVLKRRGRLVLADMYVPFGEDDVQNVQIYEWLNHQHAMKQEASGRDRSTEGTCHIPTEQGWLSLFRSAGFQADVVDHHMSLVTTTDWLISNQVDEEQLERLNHIILTAPPAAIKAFKIRKENGLVQLDYPVTIIRAEKH